MNVLGVSLNMDSNNSNSNDCNSNSNINSNSNNSNSNNNALNISSHGGDLSCRFWCSGTLIAVGDKSHSFHVQRHMENARVSVENPQGHFRLLPRLLFVGIMVMKGSYHDTFLRNKSMGLWPIRWILKILHDPKFLIRWELWYYGIVRSCRIVNINSSNQNSSLNPKP